jgi:hypothetical protein
MEIFLKRVQRHLQVVQFLKEHPIPAESSLAAKLYLFIWGVDTEKDICCLA